MPLPPPKNRTAYGTYQYFAEPGALETFMRDYRRILIDNFKKVKIEGGGEYWSCGQEHDPRNWNWKPWQYLERLCRKRGLDDLTVRDILFEHLGRNIREPLKEHGYILTYQRTEGLNGIKYIITRQ
jgi:hypothetical protein